LTLPPENLQACLLREGYYPGEEEMEDWVFGDGTQSALLTFQAASPSRPNLSTALLMMQHQMLCARTMPCTAEP
jgi:hypothetical protein